MAKYKYTKEEFCAKYMNMGDMGWDAYNLGYIHGQMDEGTKQLEKTKQELEDLNERARHFKSGPKENS